MRRWIVAAVMMFTLEEMRSSECRVACGFVGYETGQYWKGDCLCTDRKDYADITNRHPVYLPKKAKKHEPSYVDPYGSGYYPKSDFD